MKNEFLVRIKDKVQILSKDKTYLELLQDLNQGKRSFSVNRALMSYLVRIFWNQNELWRNIQDILKQTFQLI